MIDDAFSSSDELMSEFGSASVVLAVGEDGVSCFELLDVAVPGGPAEGEVFSDEVFFVTELEARVAVFEGAEEPCPEAGAEVFTGAVVDAVVEVVAFVVVCVAANTPIEPNSVEKQE